MMETLRKIKESYIYEIIKEQSGIIIFVATLLGSLFVLVTQISEYFYSLGRFSEYNIPTNLIELESVSIYHIAKVFAYIMCLGGGMATLICARMTCKTGLTVAKLQFDLDNDKKQYWKRIVSNIVVLFLLGLCVIAINALAIVFSNPKSIFPMAILLLFLISYQWFYSGWIIKSIEKKMCKKEETFDIEKEKKMIEKLEELPEEKQIERTEQLVLNSKRIIFTSKILPLILALVLLSFYCISNYSSGKNSATSTVKAYQIVVIDNENYVVLEKMNDNYILAKTIIDDNQDILTIQTSEQMIIPVENGKYKLQNFNKVVLDNT